MNLAPHERYRFKPFPGSSHQWAVSRVSALPRDWPVIDVGSGSGAIGRELRELGFKRVSAVEIDAEAREHSREYYERSEVEVSCFHGERFKIALLLDVLEHTSAPHDFLASVVSVMEPGGQILISVPNIAHWSVRFQLLLGYFEYTERGLLDKTHLSFFTRRRLRQLVERQGGLRVVSWGSSISPAEFVLPRVVSESSAFRAASRLRLAGANVIPGLLAFQHLVQVEVT